MTRDMDLIRRILIEAERQPYGQDIDEIKIEGFSSDEVSYQIMLLNEAGYVKGFAAGPTWYVERLTWNGHEFLEVSAMTPGGTKQKS